MVQIMRPRPGGPTVERYNRAARWFHVGVYLLVLVLLGTGWWFLTVGYEQPSPLARLTGEPDGVVHELTGFAFAGLAAVGIVRGFRAVRFFLAESLRFRRTDLRWFARWPAAAFTGRFAPHHGHFDPGQRVANAVMVITLAALLATGFGMLYLPPGPIGDLCYPLHRWSTFAATPVLLGHIVVAAGVLPGYRGVWRSMHLGGRLPDEVARRIWP